jgi:hypothetical protein
VDPRTGRTTNENARAVLGRKIVETLRTFVLLARLTSNPKLGKVSRRLLKSVQHSN